MYILVSLVLIIILLSGCSSKTSTKYVTGDVISRPDPEPVVNNPVGNDSNVPSEEVVVDKGPIQNRVIVATVTKSEKEIINSMSCEEDNINLGYKICLNTTDGKAVIYLKNSGYDPIVGLWFKIEVGDKVYYESTDIGLHDNSFVEYVLDLPEWKAKYGSTDRIIIIPMRDTSSGKKLCANRALLLNPMDSCTNYVGVE